MGNHQAGGKTSHRYSHEQVEAFRARLKRGLLLSQPPDYFFDAAGHRRLESNRLTIIRQGMFADLRQDTYTDEPPAPEPRTLADRPAEPVELSALLNQQEHIRAELAYLHNKVMEKRAESDAHY